MNALWTRTVVRQFGLWCALVGVVVLLTLLFTILGTITCAVLTGVMMASIKHRPWHTIPVSAVFPAVVVALVVLSKVELEESRRVLLPLLCFGAFWLMYALARGLAKLEQNSASTPSAIPAVTTPLSQPRIPGEKDREAQIAGLPPKLRLEELQGRWLCETIGPNGATKILEVTGSHLSLSVIGPHRRPRLVAQGDLKMEETEDRSRQHI